MKFRAAVLAIVALAIGAAVVFRPTRKEVARSGLPAHLRRAERIELFRLDPNDCVVDGGGESPAQTQATVVADPADQGDAAEKPGGRGLDDGGRFHGFKVVRSTVVYAPDQLVTLVSTFEHALAENVSPAKCFIPEYGVRFTSGGISEDLLISLKCQQVEWERPGVERVVALIADGPGEGGCRAAMNRLLDATSGAASP